MNWELFFRFVNLGILIGFTLIRIPYVLLSIKQSATPKDKKTSIIYAFLSLLIVFAGFYYLMIPKSLSFFSINLPYWLRTIGVLIGITGIGLLLWTHIALDRNFAMYVTSTKNHKLVTSGPYEYVRHPMYTAFFMIVVGFFLISSNLFFGGFFLLMAYALTYRMNLEERYLCEIFGTAYSTYIKKTKRLLPFFY